MRPVARDTLFDNGNDTSFLAAQFREFYAEVIRLKHQLGQGDWLFIAEPGQGTAPEAAPNAIWQVLLSLLERQALTALRTGGHLATEIYSQAQYVMAALADEIFLNLEWPGQDNWRTNLLESKLFQSHSAGETFFDRLDALLLDQDPIYVDLARVYLNALALGFQGKYRDDLTGTVELANYRKRLLTFITQREPALLEGKERLVPQAYNSVLDQGRSQQLPYLNRWVVAFALLLLIWVVGSFPVWHEITAEMRLDIEEIRSEKASHQQAPEDGP